MILMILMKEKTALIIILFSLAAAGCGSAHQFDRQSVSPYSTNEPKEEKGLVKIVCFDVGQGDSTLILAPSQEAMLIDAGPFGAGKSVILPFLKSNEIEGLKYIVATHYHNDHIGGLTELLAGDDGAPGTKDDLKPTGGIYDRGNSNSTPKDPLFQIYETQTASSRDTAHPGERFSLGGVDVEIVAANGILSDGTAVDTWDDENAAGIAMLIEYAGFRMFLAADITGGGGRPPYDTPDIETPLAPLIGDIDVLRVAHHGSLTGTNETFLAKTTPEAAVISVGDGNDYFQPHSSVIERLLNHGVLIYQTEKGWLDIDGPIVKSGNITIEADKNGSYTIF